LFADAIVGALRNRGKTVILVTHALHFLSQCDYIYTVDNGIISAQGKYADLVETNESFAKLMKDFGGETKHEEEVKEEEAAMAGAPILKGGVAEVKAKSEAIQRVGAGTGKLEGRLIVAEKRSTGSVSWKGKSSSGTYPVLTDSLKSSLWRISAGGTCLAHWPMVAHLHGHHAEQSDLQLVHARLVAGKVCRISYSLCCCTYGSEIVLGTGRTLSTRPYMHA
jgi:hypothetical protein